MRVRQFSLLILLLALVACDRDDGDGVVTATRVVVDSPTATATARPTATPQPTATPTVTPEPPQPTVEVIDQAVDEDGEVVVSHVYAPANAWVVVYADQEGERGAILGSAALEQGEHDDVSITVDPYQVTPTLHVLLHRNTAETATFDFPGPDDPILVDGETIGATLAVDLLVDVPAIAVADQAMGQDGQVVVDSVTAAEPGWVAVHADDGGEPGRILGQSPVPAGDSSNVVVRFDWRNVTRRLHAVLYYDAGEEGLFEPGAADETVVLNGQAIHAAFVVQAPPDVYVIDQPVVAAEILVERAFINEPGWIAVYSNYEGFIDRLLGFMALEAGEHVEIAVPVDPSNSTGILHVMLHEDTAVEGQFDYPADDPPLRGEEGRPLVFSFETDTGNYVITHDQPLSDEGTVEVPLVVTDLDTWVAVWTEEGGAPGEIIGQTLVERGVNRDVVVELDPGAASAGDTLFVVLHRDDNPLGQFDYPAADDILQRERAPIQAPFVLEEEIGD